VTRIRAIVTAYLLGTPGPHSLNDPSSGTRHRHTLPSVDDHPDSGQPVAANQIFGFEIREALAVRTAYRVDRGTQGTAELT